MRRARCGLQPIDNPSFLVSGFHHVALLKLQQRKKRLTVLNKQTNGVTVRINKTKKNKMNLEHTHHQPEVKTSTLPESVRHG